MLAITAAIDEMLAQAALPEWRERTAEMRAVFETRTGWSGRPLAAGDPFFEARSAAFWDDALTREAFGRACAARLSEPAHACVEPFARAHRGVFRVEAQAGEFLLVDEWSGAEFVAAPTSSGLEDALSRASGLVDGRVVGALGVVALLPGAVFHAADALAPMRALLPVARERGLDTHTLCDAMLRMDLALRSLSRVKAAFAYRKEALASTRS